MNESVVYERLPSVDSGLKPLRVCCITLIGPESGGHYSATFARFLRLREFRLLA